MFTLLSKFSVAGVLLLLGRVAFATLKFALLIVRKAVKAFFLLLLFIAAGQLVRGPVD